MMHYSLFCVPTINNDRKAVLAIYNQDLFYEGFFTPITLNCINYPGVLAKSQTTK